MRLVIHLFFLLPCIAFGQLTYVPDNNFENYLENNGMGDGIANNDSVLTANIDTVDSLNVYSKSISDLTGIEDFTALTFLDCGSNFLWSLDVSNNTALTYLGCTLNEIYSLDVSGATALTYLDCDNNQLTSLDVSNNTGLTYLDCHATKLTSLDVSNNTALTYLHCGSNQLTSLDISNNTALWDLYCDDNNLFCLNVKNGNNTNMSFYAKSNPNLSCIEVDDETYSLMNWTGIDNGVAFSTDCSYPSPCSSTGIYELLPPNKHLLTITDILGRTTHPTPNTLLFYIYEDGSVEKRIQLER